MDDADVEVLDEEDDGGSGVGSADARQFKGTLEEESLRSLGVVWDGWFGVGGVFGGPAWGIGAG